MEMHEKFDFHTVKNDNYVVMRASSGFSIDNSRQSLKLLTRNADKTWTMLAIGQQDLVEILEIEPDTLVGEPNSNTTNTIYNPSVASSLNQGMQNVGSAIGTGIANKIQERKARERSGILFRIRYIDRPEVMINIPDAGPRKQAFEAARQFLREGAVAQNKIDFPMSLDDVSHDPQSDRSKTLVEKEPAELLVNFVKHPATSIFASVGSGGAAYSLYNYLESHQGFQDAGQEDRVAFYVFITAAIVFGVFAVVRMIRREKSQ